MAIFAVTNSTASGGGAATSVVGHGQEKLPPVNFNTGSCTNACFQAPDRGLPVALAVKGFTEEAGQLTVARMPGQTFLRDL